MKRDDYEFRMGSYGQLVASSPGVHSASGRTVTTAPKAIMPCPECGKETDWSQRGNVSCDCFRAGPGFIDGTQGRDIVASWAASHRLRCNWLSDGSGNMLLGRSGASLLVSFPDHVVSRIPKLWLEKLVVAQAGDVYIGSCKVSPLLGHKLVLDVAWSVRLQSHLEKVRDFLEVYEVMES